MAVNYLAFKELAEAADRRGISRPSAGDVFMFFSFFSVFYTLNGSSASPDDRGCEAPQMFCRPTSPTFDWHAGKERVRRQGVGGLLGVNFLPAMFNRTGNPNNHTFISRFPVIANQFFFSCFFGLFFKHWSFFEFVFFYHFLQMRNLFSSLQCFFLGKQNLISRANQCKPSSFNLLASSGPHE